MRHHNGRFAHDITGKELLFVTTCVVILLRIVYVSTHRPMISPVPERHFTATVHAADHVSTQSGRLAPSPTSTPAATPTPGSSEVIAYIAEVFKDEPTDVKVRAINCFYSESGLRWNAVGKNKDKHQSTDHGVAQLNSYWHKLTEAQKTNYKENIKKAYEIYKNRGNWSAWYGKLCGGGETK